MTRVLMINPYALPPSEGGGTRHHALSRAMNAQGEDVRILTSSFDHATRGYIRPTKADSLLLVDEDGVPFYWMHGTPYSGNTAGRVWSMLQFARQLASLPEHLGDWKPDVVFGSTPHLFSAYMSMRLARRLRIPFVLEVRDIWPETLKMIGSYSSLHPFILLLAWLERAVYRGADSIVTLLPGAVDHICERGGRRESIHWLPNGVDLRLVPALSPPPNGNSLVVRYAGAHGLANGIDFILDASLELKEKGLEDAFTFEFLGSGPKKYSFRQRAEDQKLSAVHFLDPVPKHQIYHELLKADILIATSWNVDLYKYGIAPNKLYDYLVCARPVVFGIRAYNDPVAESGGGLSVAPESGKALADALIQMRNLGAEGRNAMGQRGRAYILAQHDQAKLGMHCLKILQTVLGTNPEAAMPAWHGQNVRPDVCK